MLANAEDGAPFEHGSPHLNLLRPLSYTFWVMPLSLAFYNEAHSLFTEELTSHQHCSTPMSTAKQFVLISNRSRLNLSIGAVTIKFKVNWHRWVTRPSRLSQLFTRIEMKTRYYSTVAIQYIMWYGRDGCDNCELRVASCATCDWTI